jgi:hypothetical protein
MKAPEHLYYFLLLSTHPSYKGKAEAWRSWLQMGFSVELRDGPPAAREHKLVSTIYHTPRRIEMTFDAVDPSTMVNLERLIRTLNSLRASVNSLEDEVRGEGLSSHPEIHKQLLAPLNEALAACGLLDSERAALMAPLKQALAALTSDYVVGIETSGQLAAVAR